MKTILIIAAAVSVASCAPSLEERIAYARAQCTNYGHEPGTPAYSQCMQHVDQQMLQRRQRAWQAWMNSNRTTRCTTTPAGYSYETTCR